MIQNVLYINAHLDGRILFPLIKVTQSNIKDTSKYVTLSFAKFSELFLFFIILSVVKTGSNCLQFRRSNHLKKEKVETYGGRMILKSNV